MGKREEVNVTSNPMWTCTSCGAVTPIGLGHACPSTRRTPDDPIHCPPHYTQGDIECIDALRSALGPSGFLAYCFGNTIKYLWRARHKNGLEDLRKARWYLERAIAEEEKLHAE